MSISTKKGFPSVEGATTICPFCGWSCGDIEDVRTGHFHRAVSATIGFRCISGCYWELRLESDRGESIEAECVLVDRDEALFQEMLEETQREGIVDWAHTQEPHAGGQHGSTSR